MKLTIATMLSVRSGLMSLDGYERIIKDGEREKTARVFYELGPGLRLLIAKNLNRIEPELRAYEKADGAIDIEYTGGGSTVPKEKTTAWAQAKRALLEQEAEVDLLRINVDELKLQTNLIPASVLSALAPILDGLD